MIELFELMEMFENQTVVMDVQPYEFTKITELCP